MMFNFINISLLISQESKPLQMESKSASLNLSSLLLEKQTNFLSLGRKPSFLIMSISIPNISPLKMTVLSFLYLITLRLSKANSYIIAYRAETFKYN